MIRPALLLAVAFVAASSAQAQQAFTGTWTVTKTEPAPWVAKDPNAEPTIEPALRNARIGIQPDRLDAPLFIGCRKPRYTVLTVPPEGVFEGGLYDPDHGLTDAKGLAAKLGFTADQIPTLEASCSELRFHLADNDTMLFALNNVIYTLKRAK
ncbi:MAG TPA: hypothetical protein VKS60_05000 [Stellaceae bacterium]|nr:hypothetical protein [Stellaceae bacterium]